MRRIGLFGVAACLAATLLPVPANAASKVAPYVPPPSLARLLLRLSDIPGYHCCIAHGWQDDGMLQLDPSTNPDCVPTCVHYVGLETNFRKSVIIDRGGLAYIDWSFIQASVVKYDSTAAAEHIWRDGEKSRAAHS